jgi:hypothetical protein
MSHLPYIYQITLCLNVEGHNSNWSTLQEILAPTETSALLDMEYFHFTCKFMARRLLRKVYFVFGNATEIILKLLNFPYLFIYLFILLMLHAHSPDCMNLQHRDITLGAFLYSYKKIIHNINLLFPSSSDDPHNHETISSKPET